MFKVEDAVSVDTSGYDLVAPGMDSKSPGIVLAVMDSRQSAYYVRVHLQLGGTMDLTVPAGKLALA